MIYEPMLLMSADKAFDSPDCAFELKFDGVRMLAYVSDGGIYLINRRGNERTRVYTEIAADLADLQRGVVLDGEMIALNKEGRPDFYRLLKRDRIADPSERQRREIPVRYIVFDLLRSHGEDLTGRPYRERRSLLEGLFAGIGTAGLPHIALTDVFYEYGEALFSAAAQENLEGIVAKRLDGVYTAGRRTDAWIKIKNPKYSRPK